MRIWLRTTVALLGATVIAASSGAAEPEEKQATRTDHYGDPLPERAVMRLGTVRFSQPSPMSLVFSPDGKFLISAGEDKRIRIWDSVTGKERRTLDGHDSKVDFLSLSADGKRLASDSLGGEVILWDFATGKIQRRFLWHIGNVRQVFSLSPNGKFLATSDPSTLRLWDTDTGRETFKLSIRAEALAFGPDSKQLAYSDFSDHDIHLLNATTGDEIRAFESHKSRICQMIYTPDGDTLFSCSYDRTIRSWDVASGKEKQRYGDEKEAVTRFALAPDGKTLTYSTFSSVHIWDLETNKDRMPPCKLKNMIVPAIAYSPDSKKVAVGGEGIAVYETATGKRLNPAPESECPVHQLKYALGGKLLLVWRWEDKTIELWDTANWQKIQTLRPRVGSLSAMIVSPDGKYLATGEGVNLGENNRQFVICTWDLQTGTRRKEFPLKRDSEFDALSYSADGKTLRYQQIDSQGRVFIFRDAATGKEIAQLPVSAWQPQGRFVHPESKPVLTGDGKVLIWGFVGLTMMGLWDTKTGKLFRSFGDCSAGVYYPPIFSPDGRTVAAAGTLGKQGRFPPQPDIFVWETATGRERLCIVPNGWQAKQLAFSPDGRLLASADRWESIRVWDTWTGKEVGQFTGHRGPINTLAFAPDGKTLASGGADNTTVIWNLSGLAPVTKPEKEKLSREEVAQCWNNLTDADAVRAFAAIRKLMQHPDQAESLLKDKLANFKTVDTQRLSRLIADLDSDEFNTRENASKELAILGQAAASALREKLGGKPSAELKRRLQDLLDKLDRKEEDPEQRRLLRAIEVLERVGTPRARQLLQRLVEAAPDADVARDAQATLQRLANAQAP